MPIWKNKDGTWAVETGVQFRDDFPSREAAVDWLENGDPKDQPFASIPFTTVARATETEKETQDAS